MTEQEVLDLPVGTQLDDLVAVHVMGWADEDSLRERFPDIANWYFVGERGCAPQPDWSPSTDIANAWEVAEAMQAMMPTGGAISECLGWSLQGSSTSGWQCGWLWDHSTDGPPSVDVLASGATQMEAICKAALAWALRGRQPSVGSLV